MNQDKIGKIIEQLRKKNNLTQNDLANKLGVTYQAVSKWETGKNLPDISILKQISKIFNVDINDLLEGKISDKKSDSKFKIITYVVIAIALVVIIFLVSRNSSGFQFRTIASKCDSYEISGSAAYNKDKTTIYISDILYCGDDKTIYDEISCSLYEKSGDTQTKISDCNKKGNNVNINEYLKDIKIKVDRPNNICSDNNLYLRIYFKKNNKDYFNDIDIELRDEC